MPIYTRELRRRFWQNVSRNGPLMPGMKTKCWVWTGKLLNTGYGRLSAEGKDITAHKVSWEIRHGRSVPKGKEIRHRCHNRKCVRHLQIGTRLDNMRDMVEAGHTRRGKAWHLSHDGIPLHTSKLFTSAKRHRLLKLLRQGMTQEKAAEVFGISPSFVPASNQVRVLED